MTGLQLLGYIGAATAVQLMLGIAIAVWRSKRKVQIETLCVIKIFGPVEHLS